MSTGVEKGSATTKTPADFHKSIREEHEEKLPPAAGITTIAVKRIAINKSIEDEEAPRKTKSQGQNAANEAAATAENIIYQQQIMKGLKSLDQQLMKQQETLLRLERKIDHQGTQKQKIYKKLKQLKRKSNAYWQYARVRDKSTHESLNRRQHDPRPTFPYFPSLVFNSSDEDSE